MPGYKRHGSRIYVPQRSIQGGLGEKFETDPYDVELHGLMTEHQYTEAIENLNAKLRPSRPNAIDTTLLVTGPLMVPLALWGVRHRNQVKRRKKLLKEGIHEFNMRYQELFMRWNRRPESTLTIERRHMEQPSRLPIPGVATATTATASATVAEATYVSDVIAPAVSIPGGPSSSVVPMISATTSTATTTTAAVPIHDHQML